MEKAVLEEESKALRAALEALNKAQVQGIIVLVNFQWSHTMNCWFTQWQIMTTPGIPLNHSLVN